MLQEHQNLLQLINSIPDLIFYRDRSGFYRICNLAYAEHIGISIGEIIGRHASEIIGPEQAANFLDLDTEVIKTNRPRREIIPLEHANGSIRLYEVIRAPLHDQSGSIQGISVVCRDHTEKEQLHQEAAEKSYKYQAALEANPDPMVVYNMVGEVEYINPAFTRVFGWDLEDCRGKKMDFVPDECWPETLEMIEMVKRGESFSGIESQRLTRDGRILTISISGAMFRNRNGKLQGSIITLRDITRQKSLEAQLHQSHRLESLGTLAGGIAHDFNNLLTAIRGHTSLILLQENISPIIQKKLHKIEDIVDRGAALTKQLLGFARGGKYQPEVLNVNQVVEESLEMFARTLKGLTVTTRLAPDLQHIKADRSQLDQVLLNLFVNAWQAMQEDLQDGRLEVTTDNFIITPHTHPHQTPGSYIRISIIDNGCGMDKETQLHIFEPFFSTKNENERGNGLGLSSVYGIIENHDGLITVESQLNQGTTFEIFLPTVDKSATQVQTVPENIITGTDTILLVDDEEIVRSINQELLEALGYHVLSAQNGPEALELFQQKQQRISLVILDMIMPGMNGATVFRHLRDLDPEVRVLLASGYSSEQETSAILEQGRCDFIQKPFSIKELSRRIEQIIRS
jgi:PAS domain S-box-containing protein